MSIETYRQIVNERLAAIEKARKSVQRASSLISSTFLWSALEQLKLARLEVEADLRAHERVASEKAAEQSVHWTGGDSIGFCELHQISFLQAECPRCHPASQ